MEDGEIRIIDDENYIVADSLFEFKLHAPGEVGADGKTVVPPIHWRALSTLDFDQASGQITNREDPTRDIIEHLDALAENDLTRERNTRWIGEEGLRAMLVMQFAMQYYSFAQNTMRKKVDQLYEYAQTQQKELERLEAIRRRQKTRRTQMLTSSDRLDDRAIQLEIEIARENPELLERIKKSHQQVPLRPDICFAPENAMGQARLILETHEIIKDNQTAVFDQVTGYNQNTQENAAFRIDSDGKRVATIPRDSIGNIMGMLTKLNAKVDALHDGVGGGPRISDARIGSPTQSLDSIKQRFSPQLYQDHQAISPEPLAQKQRFGGAHASTTPSISPQKQAPAGPAQHTSETAITTNGSDEKQRVVTPERGQSKPSYQESLAMQRAQDQEEAEREDLSDTYDDGFESSFHNSEFSQQQLGSSESKGSSLGKVASRIRHHPQPPPQHLEKQHIAGAQLDDEELEDLLLQEARQQHMKVRATSLSKTRGRQSNTPIKEVDAVDEEEEDFENGDEAQRVSDKRLRRHQSFPIKKNSALSELGSEHSVPMGVIEEARNYDSCPSDKTGHTQGHSSQVSGSAHQHLTNMGLQTTLLQARDELKQSQKHQYSQLETAQDAKQKSRSSQPDETAFRAPSGLSQAKEQAEEISDDYVDDEFDVAQSGADVVDSDLEAEETLVKASMDQSGRLPPLSASLQANGAAGTQRSNTSFTQLQQSREGTSRFLQQNAESASKSRGGSAKKQSGKFGVASNDGQGAINIGESQDCLVDFDLSESKFNANFTPVAAGSLVQDGKGTPLRQNSIAADSMESGDFGLSESNISDFKHFQALKSTSAARVARVERSSTEKHKPDKRLEPAQVPPQVDEDVFDYSDDFE